MKWRIVTQASLVRYIGYDLFLSGPLPKYIEATPVSRPSALDQAAIDPALKAR